MKLETKNKIANLIDSKVLLDEPLKKHTTFGVGGSAAIFVYPDSKEDLIISAYQTARKLVDANI